MSKIIYRNGRPYIVREDSMVVDALTGAALGFGLDVLMGSDSNLDGAILGGIGGAVLGPIGGIAGGLLGGLFDD